MKVICSLQRNIEVTHWLAQKLKGKVRWKFEEGIGKIPFIVQAYGMKRGQQLLVHPNFTHPKERNPDRHWKFSIGEKTTEFVSKDWNVVFQRVIALIEQ